MPHNLRQLAVEETEKLRRLAHARTASARALERARICWLAHQDQTVPSLAVTDGVCEATAQGWIKRFNYDGLAGPADAGRGSQPPTYTTAEISEVIVASLTDLQQLGLPFPAWTLDRLAAYLAEEKSIPIKRSRISTVLQAEGLRWRAQAGWFGARPDPACAAKRGFCRPLHHAARERARSVSGRDGAGRHQLFPRSPIRPSWVDGRATGAGEAGSRSRPARSGSVFGAFVPTTGEAFTTSHASLPIAN
jgi:transposase